MPELTTRKSQDSDNSLVSRGRSTPSFGDEPTISKIAVRTEEEQQAAAREARRKSLANRRVSFAAEATLHTFHEIEYIHDSTTSTEASRRASTNTGYESTVQSHSGYGPSTPRPPQPYHGEDDTTSILYSDDSEPPDAVEEEIGEEEDDDASSSDMEDGTMMTIEDVTGTTTGSMQSDASDNDSSTLDEALRIAARRAGTQQFESAEVGDSDDGEEVIPSFGWIKKGSQVQPHHDETDHGNDDGTEMEMEMDMTSAMGGIIHQGGNSADDDDMSMDVTKAFGGILPQQNAAASHTYAESDHDDATMEFTTAIGGIHPVTNEDEDDDDCANHEEMSMELTTVLGGVLSQQKRKSIQPRRQTLTQMSDSENTMDITTSMGRILTSTEANQPTQEDITIGMDMTTAIGGIIGANKSPRSLRKSIMQEEVNKPNSPNAAIFKAIAGVSPKRRSSRSKTAPVSPALSSPGLLPFRGKPTRRSVGAEMQTVSKPTSGTPSPNKPSTPQLSSRESLGKRKSRSPGTAALKNTNTPSLQNGSPSKQPQHETPASSASQPRRTSPSSRTPQRRLSGLGVDRYGLGSPLVAEIIDRRSSIGDSASKFVPGKRAVVFDDPQVMAKEIEQEEADSFTPQKQFSQDDREETINLRDMIDSLSPMKKPLKGRKSLHVGSARGVLGKRPMELDDDEDEQEENDGIKRLKGHQSSPVKNVKLPMPKADITGRLIRLNLQPSSPAMTPTRSPPRRPEPVTSPRKQSRVVDIKPNHTVHNVNVYEEPSFTGLESDQIHLQDFLDMTSIRFMELNTTKRRHTVAPPNRQSGHAADDTDDMSLEACVVASACTVPKLELYQHSCRELKKYIAEGRRMVKEIEEDTFEDNPPLFKEYMTASADVKALMDNQFKNVKTHARLLSKAMWYEWRMKLQEGLREGLFKISDDMDSDYSKLHEQQALLSSILPTLISEHALLDEERLNLEEVAQEIADCDPEELQNTRDELVDLEHDIEEKKRQIQALQKDFQSAETEVESLAAKKSNYLADIAQSEKVREDCRGWSSVEVNSLKDRVDSIEADHGWAITGVSGGTISMAYKREIELVLEAASFKAGTRSQQIDLWYIADSRDKNPSPKSIEKEFFLQSIRDCVRALSAEQGDARSVLRVVQKAWDEAMRVANQISKVNTTFQTTVTKTSDSSIDIKTTMLLVPLQTRVDVVLALQNRDGKDGVDISIDCGASVVYGEHFVTKKIADFIGTRLGSSVSDGKVDWCNAFVELQEKLIARGRK